MGRPVIQFIEDENHDVVDAIEWRKKAACSGMDTRWWFADNDPVGAKKARAICKQCAVVSECLDFAITNGIVFGLWGGLPDRQRQKIKRQRQETHCG